MLSNMMACRSLLALSILLISAAAPALSGSNQLNGMWNAFKSSSQSVTYGKDFVVLSGNGSTVVHECIPSDDEETIVVSSFSDPAVGFNQPVHLHMAISVDVSTCTVKC
eukprot:scpid103969/ scgid0644/ 